MKQENTRNTERNKTQKKEARSYNSPVLTNDELIQELNKKPTERDLLIKDIETMKPEHAQIIQEEARQIKGHNIIFCNLGKYFGYSALVFKNGRMVRHANQYQLHHNYGNPTQQELKNKYIDHLFNNLYTIDELKTPAQTYGEYQRKNNYINNFYPYICDSISTFDRNSETLKKYFLYSGMLGLSYFNKKEDAQEQIELYKTQERAYLDLYKDNEKFKDILRYELANHEAGYTGDATETLDALGIKWENLNADIKKFINDYIYKLAING